MTNVTIQYVACNPIFHDIHLQLFFLAFPVYVVSCVWHHPSFKLLSNVADVIRQSESSSATSNKNEMNQLLTKKITNLSQDEWHRKIKTYLLIFDIVFSTKIYCSLPPPFFHFHFSFRSLRVTFRLIVKRFWSASPDQFEINIRDCVGLSQRHHPNRI